MNSHLGKTTFLMSEEDPEFAQGGEVSEENELVRQTVSLYNTFRQLRRDIVVAFRNIHEKKWELEVVQAHNSLLSDPYYSVYENFSLHVRDMFLEEVIAGTFSIIRIYGLPAAVDVVPLLNEDGRTRVVMDIVRHRGQGFNMELDDDRFYKLHTSPLYIGYQALHQDLPSREKDAKVEIVPLSPGIRAYYFDQIQTGVRQRGYPEEAKRLVMIQTGQVTLTLTLDGAPLHSFPFYDVHDHIKKQQWLQAIIAQIEILKLSSLVPPKGEDPITKCLLQGATYNEKVHIHDEVIQRYIKSSRESVALESIRRFSVRKRMGPAVDNTPINYDFCAFMYKPVVRAARIALLETQLCATKLLGKDIWRIIDFILTMYHGARQNNVPTIPVSFLSSAFLDIVIDRVRDVTQHLPSNRPVAINFNETAQSIGPFLLHGSYVILVHAPQCGVRICYDVPSLADPFLLVPIQLRPIVEDGMFMTSRIRDEKWKNVSMWRVDHLPSLHAESNRIMFVGFTDLLRGVHCLWSPMFTHYHSPPVQVPVSSEWGLAQNNCVSYYDSLSLVHGFRFRLEIAGFYQQCALLQATKAYMPPTSYIARHLKLEYVFGPVQGYGIGNFTYIHEHAKLLTQGVPLVLQKADPIPVNASPVDLTT